jgi:hypothetical protein
VRAAVAALLAATVLAAEAPAGPPEAGVLVPGRSLGGIHLGWTRAQVEAAWGHAYGRCRSCRHETFFFNRYAFQPEGAGAELRAGLVQAVFTLWAPASWSTTNGLTIGDPAIRIAGLFGAFPRTQCPGYSAVVLRGRRAWSVVYIFDGEVWGFGLQRPDLPVCR